MSITWRISGIASQHRIHLALPALLGEIHREPLQIRSQFREQLHGFGGSQCGLRFSGSAGQRGEIPHQGIGRQAIQFQADVPGDAAQVFLDQQGKNKVAAADQRLAEIERAERPGIGQSPDQRRAESGSTRISGLQLRQAPLYIGFQARPVRAKVVEDTGRVGTGNVQQLGQNMFNFNVIVRAGQAQAGRALQREPHDVVQPS